jgi:hypothetical protein
MPLQTIIVNTIFDLLVVENGASIEEIKVNFKNYKFLGKLGQPTSWFS